MSKVNVGTVSGTVFGGKVSGASVSGTVSNRSKVSGDIMHTLLKGQSAYEEAVANGFEGSEEEWLASLGATVTVGEVSVGNEISIENVGTPHDAVLNFTLTDGDYEALRSKPSIENVTLSGDKTFSDLGLAAIGADDLLEILV